MRSVNYDQVAPTYAGRYQRGGYSGIEGALLQFIGNDPELRILEVGCGTGQRRTRSKGKDKKTLNSQARIYTMADIIIRNVLPKDLDDCFLVEISGFLPEEAATRETIRLRIDTFPQGFFVAEMDGRVVGMLNSAATDKDDISDEELKQLVGHDPHGKNMVVFALAVLPEFQKRGIARQLMFNLLEEARRCKKEKVLLMCKHHLIAYYERMGFAHAGLSKSTHGGAEWHEMRLTLGE